MGDRSTAADINNIQAVVEYALSKAREIDGESERERERERETCETCSVSQWGYGV